MNMNLGNLVTQVQNFAHMASGLIPGAGLADKGIAIGKKIIDIIDDIKEEVPLEQQETLQASRAQLAHAVGIKADETSARLRGD